MSQVDHVYTFNISRHFPENDVSYFIERRFKKKIKIGKTVVQNKKESEHSWETKGPGGEAAEDTV